MVSILFLRIFWWRDSENRQYAKYAVFWEIFGGKSNAAAGRRSPGFRLEDEVVLSPAPPWIFRFQNE